MPKIEYAEQATETVMGFLKQHFSWGGRPVSARQENGTWLVEVDIGVFRPRVGQVKLNRETGHIIEYEFPRLEQP
jgi:hypothetical protein